ncbi:MAG: helix-turn-helix domain-containing protein [Actinomycetia bacterium]|nr:helix-turn-helix domain-containing protein [Actinomycetes bacterium]MCP4960696.1 helix-turn-helix domain-containing protein [Actinomycetes bacterium]
MPSDSHSPALLTVPEVADLMAVGTAYVYRLVSERRIPYLKLGHHVRFDPSELAEWLDNSRVGPTTVRCSRRADGQVRHR